MIPILETNSRMLAMKIDFLTFAWAKLWAGILRNSIYLMEDLKNLIKVKRILKATGKKYETVFKILVYDS